ncbi:MAG TPA: hypothetical protein VLM85_05805 [Polyangiaceae bacterium]|nr:hypothetical protein [Polyangiaceae bacterium]
MPYRDPIDTVLARCAELRRRVEALQRQKIEAPERFGLAEALAWETYLKARLAALQVREDEAVCDDELGGIVHAAPPVEVSRFRSATPMWPFIIVGASVATLVVGLFAAFR